MPLFNGASSVDLKQIEKYLEEFKPDSNETVMGGLCKIKYKGHYLIMDIDNPPNKKFSKSYQSGPLSFEYFLDGVKIITNSGFGEHISKKAEFLSRLTACQSTLNINETSVTRFERNDIINEVFGNSVQDTFKSFDFLQEMKIDFWDAQLLTMVMKKFGCTHKREVYIDKESNYLRGIDHIFKTKDGHPIDMTLDFT